MNYVVKAFKIISNNGVTSIEDYEKPVPNYTEGKKEQSRLLALGHYANIEIKKIK